MSTETVDPSHRLALTDQEERIVAEAEADLDAGLGLSLEALAAWLDDLDRTAPPPD